MPLAKDEERVCNLISLGVEWADGLLLGDLEHIHRIRVNGAVAVGGLQGKSLEIQANIVLRHKQDLWAVVMAIRRPREASSGLVGASPCLTVGFEVAILIEGVAPGRPCSIPILAMEIWWMSGQQ